MDERFDPVATQTIAALLAVIGALSGRVNDPDRRYYIYRLYNPTTGADDVGATYDIRKRTQRRFMSEAEWRDAAPSEWRITVLSVHVDLNAAERAESDAIASFRPSLNTNQKSAGLREGRKIGPVFAVGADMSIASLLSDAVNARIKPRPRSDSHHLVQRNGVYSVRYVVPLALRAVVGRREFVRSTHTRSLEEAKRRRPAILAEIRAETKRLHGMMLHGMLH